MSSSTNKRRNTDFNQLMKSHKVEMVNDEIRVFFVYFHGPKDSLYEGGVWRVKVVLEDDYPDQPPIICFATMIYHPNIDECDGYVCVDALDVEWSPKHNLITVFDVILPWLLREPNPTSALNIEAGKLMIDNVAAYNRRVKEYCEEYAKPEYAAAAAEEQSSIGGLSEDSARSDGEETESGEHSHSTVDDDAPTGVMIIVSLWIFLLLLHVVTNLVLLMEQQL